MCGLHEYNTKSYLAFREIFKYFWRRVPSIQHPKHKRGGLFARPVNNSLKAKIYGVRYNQSSSSVFVIGQNQKAPNISAFHWSPHGSLVSIGQHFVTMRVAHLPKGSKQT